MQLAKEAELQTGDLLLFRGNAWVSKILEYMGKSKYSHVGMIIKNPSFIDPDLEDGLYVWDSSWGYIPDSEDNVYRCTDAQIRRYYRIVSKKFNICTNC